MKNLVWRTPGADGGRDIEGVSYARDISGFESVEKWYVECKRYSNSVDWPTVWEKIAYADVQRADVLLVATNSNPSPRCETEIATWNGERRRPVVRFWRGYDLPKIIRSYPEIGTRYGLLDNEIVAQASVIKLATIISKINQAAFVASEIAGDGSFYISTASALSELMSKKLEDLEKFGKFCETISSNIDLEYEWLSKSGVVNGWDDVSLRAVVCFIRHIHQAENLLLEFQEGAAKVRVNQPRMTRSGQADKDLQTMALFSNIEILTDEDDGFVYKLSQR